MNEVEKMYENCNIKKIRYCEVEDECPFMFGHRCEDCDLKPKPEYYIYPPFTAKKQIYIIKWLSDKADYVDIHYDQYKGLFNIQTGMGGLYVCNEFEQALASRVNAIWQDLTDAEKAEIKNILEM